MWGSERGETLISLLVALALTSILITLLVLGVQVFVIESRNIVGRAQIVDALVEAEDFMRKEFKRLEFSPFCASLLPSWTEMALGVGVDESVRHQIDRSIIIYKPKNGRDRYVDLRRLSGRGSGQYMPKPVKNLSGILSGSDMFLVSGFLPTEMQLDGVGVSGEQIVDMVGLRQVTFYITDCRQSVLLVGKRNGNRFEFDEGDYSLVERFVGGRFLQIYMLKEYLSYVQVRSGEPFFVIDSMDGQAFVRIAGVLGLVVKPLVEDMLNVVLVAGRAAGRSAGDIVGFELLTGSIYQNADEVDVREIVIDLGW